MVKCAEGQSCCDKGGKKGCFPASECGGGSEVCFATDCTGNPTPECLQARFSETLKRPDCSCEETCGNEFNKLGTTQGYDGASMRPVSQIVTEDHGLTEGSPAYWEKFEELHQEALTDCRKQCGDCETAEPLSLSGPPSVTKPGSYQYSATGGLGDKTWSVSGTGATIDESGMVSLSEEACGSFTVSVTDKCGRTASSACMVSNNGHWVSQGRSCSAWDGDNWMGSCQSGNMLYSLGGFSSNQSCVAVGCNVANPDGTHDHCKCCQNPCPDDPSVCDGTGAIQCLATVMAYKWGC
jgi:hypothetical protein